MQYRRPVGGGPSLNTWPRWPPHRLHRTSVRIMPRLVSRRSSTELSRAFQKLGHPVPLSNLVSEEKRCSAQPAQLNTPRRCSSSSGLLYGASVPALRSTSYWAGVRSFRHSASVWVRANGASADADIALSTQLPIVTTDSAVTLAVMRNRRLVTSMALVPRAVRGIRCNHRNVADASRSLLFRHSS